MINSSVDKSIEHYLFLETLSFVGSCGHHCDQQINQHVKRDSQINKAPLPDIG